VDSRFRVVIKILLPPIVMAGINPAIQQPIEDTALLMHGRIKCGYDG
jgi:hypothetical protein